MRNETAFRIVREILLENHENGELEGVLNRSRVAAVNRILKLAEPEFFCRRRATQLVIYQRQRLAISDASKYKRIGRLELPG